MTSIQLAIGHENQSKIMKKYVHNQSDKKKNFGIKKIQEKKKFINFSDKL